MTKMTIVKKVCSITRKFKFFSIFNILFYNKTFIILMTNSYIND